MSEDEKEMERAVRRRVVLTCAQLSLVRTGIAMRRESMILALATVEPDTYPDYKRLKDLTGHIAQEREQCGEGEEVAVTISLEELYLVFQGLESYEQQMLGSKFEPLGEVRALIEKLRLEMIRREMDRGEIQAALCLTPMGKAIMARISPEQLFW